MSDRYVQGQVGSARVVANRFKLQQLLGQGVSGRVYRAHDTARDTTVAIKFLTSVDPASLFRFKSEFRTLANLSHPNLLQLYELVSHDEAWLLVMELVEGSDFLSFVRPSRRDDALDGAGEPSPLTTEPPTGGSSVVRQAWSMPDEPLAPMPRSTSPYDEGRLRGAMLQLCEGLAALHREDRLHRDLKPANVLVSSADARLVICDFGLALEGAWRRRADDDGASTSPFAASQRELAGTLAFMSPEQAQGRALTPASDWYSVGVMLYQALTARIPFDASLSYRAMLCAKLANTPIDPAELDPQVPAELARLALSLLEPNPEHRAGYAEAVAALEGVPRDAPRRMRKVSILVGRDTQLAQLSTAFDQSRRGSAAMVLVSGPSGMGKSALVDAFLLGIEREHAPLVLRGRCYEREDLPYKAVDPLIDALSSYLMTLDAAVLSALIAPSTLLLTALFPALRRVPEIAALGEAAPLVADLHERRRLAFRALRELLGRLARRSPLVLVIDDLQWGDLDSAPFFQELFAPPDAPALLLICACRSEDEDRSTLLQLLRGAPTREEHALRIIDVKVGALSSADATRLALALLAEKPSAEPAAELIAREAEGSPFFIGELAAYVLEHGVDAAGRLGLEALLREQLAMLSPDSRALLSAVALAGRPIVQSTLQAALKFGPATYRALRDLEARRLVVTSRVGAEEHVECAHDRIREAACQAVGAAHAEFLHRRLAEAFEAEPNRDCDALLTHWRIAGDRTKAREYAVESAERAERALAFARAAELYREALELSPETDPSTRPLRARLGHALILAGRGAEAAAEFSALVPTAPHAEALTFRTLAATQLLRAGKLVEAFAELARADDLFGLRLPRAGLQALFMLLTRKLRMRCGVFDERLLTGIPSRISEAQSARIDALWEVAAALSSADFLRGNVYGAELMLRARRLRDPRHLAGAFGLEAVNAAAANRPARVQKLFELSEQAAERVDDLHLRARVKGMQAICRHLEGRWLESVELASSSQELYQRSARVSWDHAIMIWWELTAGAYAGQLEKLAARVPEELSDAEKRGDVYAATSFRTHRNCWAWLAADRPELVDAQVAIAEREWTPNGYQFQRWHMTYARAEADLYRGAAMTSLERLQREWGRARLVRQVRNVLADMLYTRARLTLTLLADQYQSQLLDRAISDGHALRRIGMPYTRALGTLVLAGAATFQDRAAALSLWAEAELQLEHVDMALHVEAVRARRGELSQDREGKSQLDSALANIRALGARRPEAFVRLLAPSGM